MALQMFTHLPTLFCLHIGAVFLNLTPSPPSMTKSLESGENLGQTYAKKKTSRGNASNVIFQIIDKNALFSDKSKFSRNKQFVNTMRVTHFAYK